MIHASTFSGIGAPEIAAEMLGWENAFHCEINPFCRKILDFYFPNSKSYEDITKTDFSEWRGKIDVLTGGFPCQPFSYAGKRRGSQDDRYLWPYMLRCIEQVRPTWFVGENVAGITTMVMQGENVTVGSGGTLFDTTNYIRRDDRFVIEEICQQLKNIGYSSSRCLYRLVPWEPLTDETGCSSLRTEMLPTPNTSDQFNANNKDGHDTEKGYLRQVAIDYAMQNDLLPTPLAVEVEHKQRVSDLLASGATDFHSRANGEIRPNGLMDYLRFKGILPTPQASEGEKFTNKYNPNSQMGQSLSAMAGSGLLPTPRANKVTDCDLNNEKIANRNHANLEEEIAKVVTSCPKTDGEPFRLSPLFTEEMMGFPLMWTTLPFLSANGSEKA